MIDEDWYNEWERERREFDRKQEEERRKFNDYMRSRQSYSWPMDYSPDFRSETSCPTGWIMLANNGGMMKSSH